MSNEPTVEPPEELRFMAQSREDVWWELAAVGHEGLTRSELAERTGHSYQTVNAALQELSDQDIAEQHAYSVSSSGGPAEAFRLTADPAEVSDD